MEGRGRMESGGKIRALLLRKGKKEVDRREGRGGTDRGRDLPDQCQSASYAPVDCYGLEKQITTMMRMMLATMTKCWSHIVWASWVKNVASTMLQLSNKQLPISDGEDNGCSKFNFTLKFSQNGGLLAPNFVFLEEYFPTRRKFFDRL